MNYVTQGILDDNFSIGPTLMNDQALSLLIKRDELNINYKLMKRSQIKKVKDAILIIF